MNRPPSPSSPTAHAPLRIIALAAGAAMCAGLGVALPARAAAPDPELAAEGLPPGMPAAALAAEPPLPAADGWPFPEDFSRISGTSRLDAGALLWTDWLYDDTGAGDYTYSAPEAAANGADVFRAAVAIDAEQTYWRVDWNTSSTRPCPWPLGPSTQTPRHPPERRRGRLPPVRPPPGSTRVSWSPPVERGGRTRRPVSSRTWLPSGAR